MKNPLVSVCLMSYRDLEYMDECLNSIFAQTYDNIELVISNDGHEDFCIDSVKSNVNKKAGPNIKNLIVSKNSQNLGINKHQNVMLDLSAGEYIAFLACDDIFNNKHVIEDVVKGFDSLPEDVMHIVGQVRVMNHDMSEVKYLQVSDSKRKIINETPPYELYRNYLVLNSFMPMDGVYKREAFSNFGRFVEDYLMLSSWQNPINYARQGMRTYCMDITIYDKRLGGISKRELCSEDLSQKALISDIIRLQDNLLKRTDELSPHILDEIRTMRDIQQQRFDETWGGVCGYRPRKDTAVPSVVVFGAGKVAQGIASKFGGIDIKYYVDNNRIRHGTMFNGKPVKSFEELCADEDRDFIVLIGVAKFHTEIKRQLIGQGVFDDSRIINYVDFCKQYYEPIMKR